MQMEGRGNTPVTLSAALGLGNNKETAILEKLFAHHYSQWQEIIHRKKKPNTIPASKSQGTSHGKW